MCVSEPLPDAPAPGGDRTAAPIAPALRAAVPGEAAGVPRVFGGAVWGGEEESIRRSKIRRGEFRRYFL